MKHLRLLILFCSVVLNLNGQDESVVSLRALQLSGGQMPEAWVMVQDEDEPVELPWLGSQPTQPLNVLHDGSLKLWHYVTSRNGEKELALLHIVRLPPSAKEILLLGAADGDSGKYVAIEDSFMEAKYNDWLAINTSGETVAIRAGDKGKPVIIKGGSSAIFQPKIEEGKGVKILALIARNGKAEPFYSTYWPAFAGQRTMIIFYRDGDRMRARRIGDRFIREEKEKL